MKYLKILGLAAIAAAALMAFAGSASATELTCTNANKEEVMCTTGTVIHAVNEGTVTLDPPFGAIECTESTIEGSTTTTGSETETVKGNISVLTFVPSSCNATVTVIQKGSLEIHTKGTSTTEGTVTSSGTEVTVEFFGTHCIFKTENTDIGTLTGSTVTGSTATFDISATIPRTGGRSGAFCGTNAAWTGNYKIDKPDWLGVH